MAKKTTAAAAARQFRVLRGLNFKTGGVDGEGRPLEARLEAGEVVDAGAVPAHGSGQCDAGCQMKGDHDWFLSGAGAGGDPVLELVEEKEE
jgi:hypothetical protein